MSAKQLFEDLAAKIGDTLADSPAKDLQKNAKAMMSGAFAKMDLVSREEFDIQQQILIKTRSKLAEAEARIAALEARFADTAAPAAAATNETADDMAAPAALSDGVKSSNGGDTV